MGGSANRMGSFAELIAKEIGHHDVERHQLDISKTDRFSFYKIGPVISVNVSNMFISFHSSIHLFIHSSIHPFICSSIHLFIHSSVHPFIYSSMEWVFLQ